MSTPTLTALPEPRVAFDRISLRRLVLIRWVAIAGQAVTLLVVHYAFDFHVPLLPCFAVVGCSVVLNLFVTLHRRVATRLGEREAAVFLGYDLLQLGLLLYLTGGLQNPFAILILAPVTVAAAALSLRPVIALAVPAIAVITLLALWHLPLPWRSAGAPPVFPPELVLGLWTALVLATVFIGGYAWSIAEGARRLRDAVAATQLALAREQRVSAVGALAAAAAHELGSPLATIAVVAKELVHRAARRLAAWRGCPTAAEPVGAVPRDPRATGASSRRGRRLALYAAADLGIGRGRRRAVSRSARPAHFRDDRGARRRRAAGYPQSGDHARAQQSDPECRAIRPSRGQRHDPLGQDERHGRGRR